MSLHNVVLRLLVAAMAAASGVAGAEAPPLARADGRSASVASLAEAAARIRLQRPDDGGPVVVTDHNLDELARRGTLSVAGRELPPEVAALPATEPNEEERRDFQRRLEEQESAVADLERTLREFERRVEQARDPSWRYGPHSFAPGQVSSAQVIREEVEQELAVEREKLQEIRREGRRTGMLPPGGGS